MPQALPGVCWDVNNQDAASWWSHLKEHGALLMALQFQALCSFSTAVVAGLLLLSVGPEDARSEPGPFAALSGSWAGGGMINNNTKIGFDSQSLSRICPST